MIHPADRAQVHIGQTSVTYLPDGHAWLDPEVVFPASAPAGWAGFLDADGRFPVSIGSFLIRVADRVILVDLGLGAVEWGNADLRADFRGGDLIASLAAEGLAPADVDTVFFTHLHHDHVGWTTGAAYDLTFPRARHLVAEAEWRHWLGTDEVVGPHPAAVMAPLADRVEFTADGAEIAPGVRVLATPGHTPGHQSLVVTDPQVPSGC